MKILIWVFIVALFLGGFAVVAQTWFSIGWTALGVGMWIICGWLFKKTGNF